MNGNPGDEAPRVVQWLLERLAPHDEFGRSVIGDLTEEWRSIAASKSRLGRRLWYWRQALPIGLRFGVLRLRGPGGVGSGGAHGRLRSLGQDVTFAIRSLRRSPLHSILAVTILALAIGANTAMLTVAHGTLLRELPYTSPDRLIRLSTLRDGQPFFSGTFAYPDLEDYQTGNATFTEIVAYLPGEMTLIDGTRPERLQTARVSAPFFDVLGVRPALGRFFTPAENQLGHAPVVVLSYGLWQSRFGGDPDVIGKLINLPRQYEVVGVAPADFEDPYGRPALWIARPPLMDATQQSRYGYFVYAFGRLRDGVSVPVAAADIERITASLRADYSEKAGLSVDLVPVRESMIGDARPPIIVLSGAVLLLLLIACSNIANLQVSRAIGRQQEWAVRSTLGARRGRLIRQVVVEVAMLSVLAGLVGLLLAVLATPVLLLFAAGSLPRPIQPGLTPASIGYAAAGAALSVITCAIGPAWHAARRDIAAGVRQTGRQAGSLRMARLRGAFVVSQLALSTVLLVASALLLKSFTKLVAVDVGVETAGLLTFKVNPLEEHYPEPDQITNLWLAVEQRMQSLPGVIEAGGATQIPMGTGTTPQFSYRRDDLPGPTPGEFRVAQARTATAGYFRAIGLRLLRGRFPAEQDVGGAHQVVAISESLVREAFGGEDPIGRFLTLQETSQEIVGIVADVRTAGPWEPALPMVWTNQAQEPADWMRESMIFVLRVQGDPLALVEAVRTSIGEVDPTIAITDVRTMESVVATAISAPRFRAVLTGGFGVMALLLAALGVGGVIGYGVVRRTGEIGIRAALGADRRRIMSDVLSRGVALALTGAALGVAGAALVTRLLGGLLFDVAPLDPATFVMVPMVLIGIAVLASWLPALAAARIDPTEALRRS